MRMATVEAKLGRNVASYRKLAGLTQEQLAEEVGVTSETISRLERGIPIPSLARIDEFAVALGLDLADLVRFRRRTSYKGDVLDRLRTILHKRPRAELELLLDLLGRICRQKG